MEEISIWWEGSFSYEEIIDDKIDKKTYHNKASDIGLYAIYGNHILYGNEILLYIGITTDQDFKNRLKDRSIIVENNDFKNLKIYLGKIYSDTEKISKKLEKEKIKKAEALLINVLKPSLNSSYINSVDFSKISNKEDFIVFNYNSYRSLLPEVSTIRWWSEISLNFEYTKQLAKVYDAKLKDDEEYYGFSLVDNDNIFVGIDYNYWDKKNIPIVIGIYKEAIKEANKKEALKKEFPNLGKDKEYYYISACDNLKSKTALEDIKNNVDKVKNLFK